MITVIHILVFLHITGKSSIHGCLTWDYDGNSITFICETEGSRIVRLVDNHEENVARCVFNGSSGKCESQNFVKSIIREHFVTFRIERKLKTDLDGNWSCLLQDNQFRTEVLTSKDLTYSTTVNLFGKIVEDGEVQRLLLTCSSCRIPKGKRVEFLVNNSSEDIITLRNETGKCASLHGDCTSSKCNCSLSGNTFALFLLVKKQLISNTNFSCEMKFEDQENDMVFSKVPTLSFNGKEFKYRDTQTVRTKYTDVHNLPKDTANDTVGKIVAGISIPVVIVIIMTVAVYSYLKKGKRYEMKKEPDESTRLIDNNSEESKSVNTDFMNQIGLRLGEITHTITEAETQLTNERSEIELRLGEITDTIPETETQLTNERSEIGVGLNKHTEAPHTDLMTMIESLMKTFNDVKTAIQEVDSSIKRYFEPQTTCTNVKMEHEIRRDPSDVDHVQTPNNSKQSSKPCSITEDTNPKSESKKDSTNANGEMNSLSSTEMIYDRGMHAEPPDVNHLETLNHSKQSSLQSMTQDEHPKCDTTHSDPSSQTEPCREVPQVDTSTILLPSEKVDLTMLADDETQSKTKHNRGKCMA